MIRARRPQAEPLYVLKPTRIRLRRRPPTTWHRDLGDLLGGCVLVVAAVYLWFGVGPR